VFFDSYKIPLSLGLVADTPNWSFRSALTRPRFHDAGAHSFVAYGVHDCLDCVERAGGPPHRRIFFQPTSQSAVAFRGIPALWRGRALDPMRPAVRGYRPVELSRSREGGSMISLQYPGGARNERGPAHPGSIRSKANRVLCGKLICCSLR